MEALLAQTQRELTAEREKFKSEVVKMKRDLVEASGKAEAEANKMGELEKKLEDILNMTLPASKPDGYVCKRVRERVKEI